MAETSSESISNTIPGSGWQLLRYAAIGIVSFVLLLSLLGYLTTLSDSRSVSSGAVDVATNTITLALSEEPPQLDSTRATDQVSGMLLGHVMEGLLRYDSDDNLTQGVAESWTHGELEATFKLRADAMWSNGTPVTAHDFVFSWRKVVEPATASQYAFIVFPIKNAEAINQGKMGIEELGARAIDDRTLHVALERPTPHFLKLMAFPTYFPINEEFYEATNGAYGANAEDLNFNGPFVMSQWAHGANVRLDKNPTYWNRDAVILDTINYAYILRDTKATLNLFESREIVQAGLNAEELDRAMKNRWVIKQHNDGSVFYMSLNHRPGRLTANHNLRRALQLVNDPQELVNKVIKLPGILPGESLFPVWLRGVDGYFREEYPAPKHVPNEQLARQHLAMALEELNLTELPPLFLLTGDNPTTHKQAEYYQNLFLKKLGIEIKIDRQIFKQRLDKMTRGDFDLVMAGWGPDYDDALTFGDLFASWNENNRGRFADEELDAQVAIAQTSSDQRVRMEAFNRIQQIMHDRVAILIQYERGSLYVIDDRVKGVVRRAVGVDPDYSFAYIDVGQDGSN